MQLLLHDFKNPILVKKIINLLNSEEIKRSKMEFEKFSKNKVSILPLFEIHKNNHVNLKTGHGWHKDCGIEILALSPKDYAQQTYGDFSFSNVVYYNVNPPFDDFDLFEKTEIVYHACEWDKNYLNEELTQNLKNFLLKNKNNVEFKFMEGML